MFASEDIRRDLSMSNNFLQTMGNPFSTASEQSTTDTTTKAVSRIIFILMPSSPGKALDPDFFSQLKYNLGDELPGLCSN